MGVVVYRYRAMTFDGKSANGSIAAETKEEFLSKLRQENMYCLSYVTEEKVEKIVSAKLKMKEILFFCKQMASMLRAGMTVIKSLDMVGERIENSKTRKVYRNLYENVQKGKSLSEAMAMEGNTFPKLVVNMTQYGEISGTIDQSMQKLAETYEKEMKLKAQVKSAMMYPMVLGIICVAVLVLLMVAVLPSLTESFPSDQLPLPTAILMGISDSITSFWYVYVLVILSIVVGMKALMKNDAFKLGWDKFKLKMPKIGKLQRTIATARFARTLATLYSSGVPLIDALQVSVKICGNCYMENEFKTVVANIKQGMSLSAAITQSKLFDPVFCSMVHVGEESGELDTMLLSISNFYDDESAQALTKLVGIIQPVLICVMAMVIGFVIISIMLPMYTGLG